MKIIHKITHQRIDIPKKDLREVLSYIYGKRAAKLYVDRGFTLSLKFPKPIEFEEEGEE